MIAHVASDLFKLRQLELAACEEDTYLIATTTGGTIIQPKHHSLGHFLEQPSMSPLFLWTSQTRMHSLTHTNDTASWLPMRAAQTSKCIKLYHFTIKNNHGSPETTTAPQQERGTPSNKHLHIPSHHILLRKQQLEEMSFLR